MHLHTVLPDGVFALPAPDEEPASFIALPPPKTEEVARLLPRVVKRVKRCMTRYFEGRSDDDALDAMDALAAASMASRKDGDGDLEQRRGRQEAFLEGFSLHAATHLHANDRAGLERLCRYGARWEAVGSANAIPTDNRPGFAEAGIPVVRCRSVGSARRPTARSATR